MLLKSDTDEFTDPKSPELGQPDTAIIDAVDSALARLEPDLREIILKRYWEQLTIKKIAGYLNIDTIEAKSRLRQACGQLRPLLSDFAANRWNFRPQGACRICNHIRRDSIDKMLIYKDPAESWGLFGKRLEAEIGEKIHPPRILIVHLSHIIRKGANNAEARPAYATQTKRADLQRA